MINIAVIGSTGLVGQEMVKELAAFTQNKEITCYASSRSAGKYKQIGANSYYIHELTPNIDFAKYDIALFSAGSQISKKYAPLFANNQCYVIDNSSAFRFDDDKPLLVMGVNLEQLKQYESKIIANPNCSTIQSVIAINKLLKLAPISDIDYVTYQSVSGSGLNGLRDLALSANGLPPENYQHPIANNIIPQIDKMLDNAFTFEEYKMITETKKILNIETPISATCVRIPIARGHSVQIRLEFTSAVNLEQVYKQLRSQRHLQLLENELPMPINTIDTSQVVVGRVRVHNSNPNILHLMCTADNLKVGAASNSCQIAKYIIEEIIC